MKTHDVKPAEQKGELQEKQSMGKSKQRKSPPAKAPSSGKRTRGEVKEAFKAQCLKRTKPSGSIGHEKGLVGREEAKIEIPVHNVNETPSRVTKTAPLPVVVEAQETDPIMEELLRQKQ